MLIIGLALGSIIFPVTKIETTTLLSSVTSTQSDTMTQLFNLTETGSEVIQNYVSSTQLSDFGTIRADTGE